MHNFLVNLGLVVTIGMLDCVTLEKFDTGEFYSDRDVKELYKVVREVSPQGFSIAIKFLAYLNQIPTESKTIYSAGSAEAPVRSYVARISRPSADPAAQELPASRGSFRKNPSCCA